MANENSRSGRCHCGAIKFETISSPSMVEYCHCNTCRKLHGSAVSTLVGFSREKFKIEQGSPIRYESSLGVYRSFCGNCGTRLFWESDTHNHEIYISLGAFDSPDSLPADCHVWTSNRLSWLEILDDLPQYPEFKKNETGD